MILYLVGVVYKELPPHTPRRPSLQLNSAAMGHKDLPIANQISAIWETLSILETC